MKILLVPHAYIPGKIAGCETYLHRVAKYLISQGHEVKCLILYKDPYIIDGVICERVQHELDWRSANTDQFLWADIVFTQLWGVPFAINKCKQLDKRLIYVAHNTNQSTSFQHMGSKAFILYNSNQLKSFLKFRQTSFVLEPPVNYRDFKKTKNGAFITLVNHCENKGGRILVELAKRLPHIPFLGIRGGYGEQIKADLPNLKYEDPQPIEDVLSRSKIVIMPSLIETYGQVAIEAYACGVPVIASPTEGLKESMGPGGIFIDRSDLESYISKIVTLLNDPGAYLAASRHAYNRAVALDPLPKLDSFHNWLNSIV